MSEHPQGVAGQTDERPDQGVEVGRAGVKMSEAERARKVAEIRSRIDAGLYDSREVIERVVDRLLNLWHLDTPRGVRKPDA